MIQLLDKQDEEIKGKDLENMEDLLAGDDVEFPGFTIRNKYDLGHFEHSQSKFTKI